MDTHSFAVQTYTHPSSAVRQMWEELYPHASPLFHTVMAQHTINKVRLRPYMAYKLRKIGNTYPQSPESFGWRQYIRAARRREAKRAPAAS